MRARVAQVVVEDDPERLALVAEAAGDLIEAGGIDELVTRAGERRVTVTFAPGDAP